MAKYFRNTGDAKWSTITNWSASSGGASVGAIPTAAEDVIFDSNSGDCELDASVTKLAKTLDCTNYVGTLLFNANLTIAGNMTLGTGMTITPSVVFGIAFSASTTITTNGITVTVPVNTSNNVGNIFFVGNQQYTSLTINGYNIFNGLNICISKNFSVVGNGSTSGVAGSATFILNGTGAISMTGSTIICLQNNLIINTTGTITLLSDIYFTGTATLLYTAGLVDFGIYKLILSVAGRLALSGLIVPRVVFSVIAASTIYLISELQVSISFVGLTPYNFISSIASLSPNPRKKLTLLAGCTQDIERIGFSDIDASNGQTIYTYKGNILNCLNVSNLPVTVTPFYYAF